MTQRKPRGMTWESWIDRQMRQAEEDGAFQDLPGRGEPLPNLHEVADPAWWAKNLLKREGVSVLPPALDLRRKVERMREHLVRHRRERDVRAAVEDMNIEIAKQNRLASSGPPTNLAVLDPDALVAEWRRQRSEMEARARADAVDAVVEYTEGDHRPARGWLSWWRRARMRAPS